MLWKSFREFAAANPNGTLEDLRSGLASSVQHCDRDKLADLARLLSLITRSIQSFGKSKTVSSLISAAANVRSEAGVKARRVLVHEQDDDEDEPILTPRSNRELLGGVQSRRMG